VTVSMAAEKEGKASAVPPAGIVPTLCIVIPC